MREHLDNLCTLFHAARLDGLPHHDFVSCHVKERVEDEGAIGSILASRRERPTGQSLGDLKDILLFVAPLYADCVELHQLAGIILVEPFGLVEERLSSTQSQSLVLARFRLPRVQPLLQHLFRCRAQPVVQVNQHRRVLRGA